MTRPTVTSVDPLRVTPDGDTSPLAEAPDTLVGDLTALTQAVSNAGN